MTGRAQLLAALCACAVSAPAAASAESFEFVSDKACRTAHECETRAGFSIAAFGMAGVISSNGTDMSTALGTRDLGLLEGHTPSLEGVGPYLGGGLRLLGQGRIIRGGLGAGVAQTNHGMTQFYDPLPSGVTARPETAMLIRAEAFLGAELDLRPIYPYADLAVWLDVVQTRFSVSSGELSDTRYATYDAYAPGFGPRVGIVVPIVPNVYLDLSTTVGILGVNRVGVGAGFGYTTGDRPPHVGCGSDCR